MPATGLSVETVPIDSIHEDPANVRRHPDRNISAIAASLARFGQQRPILIDGKGVVRAGNGTLAAALSLGWTEISVIRTGLAGAEATAYSIADNRTAELAEWDDAGLAETLRALQSEGDPSIFAATGFADDEVDHLIDRLADNATDDADGSGAGEQNVPDKYEIVVECHDETHQRETFERLQAEGFSCRVITF